MSEEKLNKETKRLSKVEEQKRRVREELKGCNNLMELIGKANLLKQAGESESVVNRIVMELRKDMVKRVAPVKRISRKTVPTVLLQREGSIPFQVIGLNKPFIVYDGENIVL